jgi:HEAT repeat protein
MGIFRPPNLEKMKTDKNLKKLIKALSYQRDKNIRKAAAGFLGQMGEPLAVGPLVVALKDEAWIVREAAAEALGKIGGTGAVEPLIAAIADQDRSRDVSEAAAKALGEIGAPRAVEPLIKALEDGRANLRCAAARALGEIGDSCGVEPLIAKLAFRDEDEERQEARFRRGEIPSRFNFSSAIREAAAEALGKIADSRAVGPLISVLHDKEICPRKAAVEALIKIGNPGTVDLLIDYLIELPSCDTTYLDVLDIFIKIGDPPVESLIAAFRERTVNKHKGGHSCLAKVLGDIGDPRAVESLIAAIADVDGDVSEAAVEALGKIGDPRAVEPLIKVLKDGSWRLGCAAARALGEIGDSRGVEPLISIVVSPGDYQGSFDLSEAAALALCKMYRKGELDMPSKKNIQAVRDRIKRFVFEGIFPG